MPQYKVFYFSFRALAEGARLLLAYGQEGFEDVRFTDDEWPSYKPCKHTIIYFKNINFVIL